MDFYLMQVRGGSIILYTEGERIDPLTHELLRSDFTNPVDRLLQRLQKREGRIPRFLRNLIIVVRDTYYRLEEKIDPMERVFKLMRHAGQLRVFHTPTWQGPAAQKHFIGLLARNQRKHTAWGIVDLVITLITVLLSPILVPLPGPNIFFYYPAARLTSHYLARRGVLHGASLETLFVALPELSEIENLLNQPPSVKEFDRIEKIAISLRLEHLGHFLKRYAK
jgi:hypothetical protein